MYRRGHVTNDAQVLALYQEYGVPYHIMKRSGEIRAKMNYTSRYRTFELEVKSIIYEAGAKWLLDHMDICDRIDDSGREGYVFIASPYNGDITDELRKAADEHSFVVELSGFYPYNGINAIVIRRRTMGGQLTHN